LSFFSLSWTRVRLCFAPFDVFLALDDCTSGFYKYQTTTTTQNKIQINIIHLAYLAVVLRSGWKIGFDFLLSVDRFDLIDEPSSCLHLTSSLAYQSDVLLLFIMCKADERRSLKRLHLFFDTRERWSRHSVKEREFIAYFMFALYVLCEYLSTQHISREKFISLNDCPYLCFGNLHFIDLVIKLWLIVQPAQICLL
jgi:hypothetical protein